MNTWLVLIDEKYRITHTFAEKPNFDGKIIAKIGDMVYQFYPGYAENDLVYTKIISGFSLTHDKKNFNYILLDQNDRRVEVNKERVYVLGPLVNSFIHWLFCKNIITFRSDLE